MSVEATTPSAGPLTRRMPAPGLGRVGLGLAFAGVLAWAMAVAALVAVSPLLGLLAAAGSAVFLTAPALQVKVGVNPWWPVFIVAALQPMNGVRPIPGASIGDLSLVVLAVAAIPTLRHLTMPPRLFVPFLGTLILAAGGLLGSIVSQDFVTGTGAYGGSGAQIFKFLVGAPLMLLLMATVNPTPGFATVLARGYALGAAISSIAAMAGRTDPYFQRAFGLGVHQLHLALSAMFGVLVALGWLLSTRKTWERWCAGSILGLCMIGLLLSGARSALLGLGVAILFLGVLGRAKGIIATLGLGSLGLGLLYLLAPLFPQGSTIYRLFGHGELQAQTVASNNLHIVYALDSVREISKSPLTGVGFSQGLDAHNLFLQAANIGGVLGLAAMILIWSSIALQWLRILARGVSREEILPATMLAGVLGYFVLGQLENILWDRHLWFFIAISLLAIPQDEESKDGPP